MNTEYNTTNINTINIFAMPNQKAIEVCKQMEEQTHNTQLVSDSDIESILDNNDRVYPTEKDKAEYENNFNFPPYAPKTIKGTFPLLISENEKERLYGQYCYWTLVNTDFYKELDNVGDESKIYCEQITYDKTADMIDAVTFLYESRICEAGIEDWMQYFLDVYYNV